MRATLAKIIAGSMIAGAALLVAAQSDSDGSGEAGETGTGSTEGDSAGPQDIAQSPLA